MTTEELRLHVLNIQQMRQSFQTFKANTEESEREVVSKTPRPKAKVNLDEFEDMF